MSKEGNHPISDEVDLRVDLNSEDDTGLPWAFFVMPVTQPSCATGHGSSSAPARPALSPRSRRSTAIWFGSDPYRGRCTSTDTSSLTTALPDDDRRRYLARDPSPAAGRLAIGTPVGDTQCSLVHPPSPTRLDRNGAAWIGEQQRRRGT
jgi:hypothetical protein